MKRSMMAIVMALGVLTASCYGKFELTKKLYNWNGQPKDKIAREGIFLVLVILPAYAATTIVDAVVLNSIEFWTGHDALQSSATGAGDIRAVMTGSADAGTLEIQLFRHDRLVDSIMVCPEPDGSLHAYRSDGTRLLSRTAADGSIQVCRADGSVVASYAAADANRYLHLN